MGPYDLFGRTDATKVIFIPKRESNIYTITTYAINAISR